MEGEEVRGEEVERREEVGRAVDSELVECPGPLLWRYSHHARGVRGGP